MKTYRTGYSRELKNRIRNYAETANLDSVIVGVEVDKNGAMIVAEGEREQVDLIIEFVTAAKGGK